MKINKRLEIGIKAIGVLKQKEAPTKTEDLSKAVDTSVKFLEQIMCDLSKAGIVYVKRGRGGGYIVNPDYKEITAFSIASALGDEFSIFLGGTPPSVSDKLNNEITEAFLRIKL